MKKKKPIKKCTDCPPDECCHCKDKMKLKKKKERLSKEIKTKSRSVDVSNIANNAEIKHLKKFTKLGETIKKVI